MNWKQPMTTEQRIEQIKERAERATAGPWTQEECGGQSIVVNPVKIVLFAGRQSQDIAHDTSAQQIECNADFIAHAREDVPFLLQQIEELKEWGQAFRVYGSTPDAALQCIQRWQADSIALQSIELSANRPDDQTHERKTDGGS
jgi:hypothetical protein